MPLRAAALERLSEWERSCTRRLNGGVGIRPVRVLFRAVSRLGNGALWYVLTIALCAAGRPGLEAAARMAAAGAVGLLAYKLLKAGMPRPRPYRVIAGIRAGIDPLDVFSFPSGHTLHAVAFTIIAVAYFPMLAWALVPFTLLVAVSRVVLELHYPSDVLAGAAIGAGIAEAALLL